ncbi:hypothetical protein Avbf_00734 [Armadillidium vulgare]|nr:hypothetical protein Avbf_00734 [Armadillidium vulgare]
MKKSKCESLNIGENLQNVKVNYSSTVDMKQSIGRNRTGGNSIVSKNVPNFKSKKVKNQKRKWDNEQRDKGNIDSKKLKASQKDEERLMSEDVEKFSKSRRRKTSPTKFVGINRKNKLQGKNLHNNYKYEENQIMTNFEGIWILRKNLKSMKKLSKETKLKIISDRKNEENNVELTPEEQQLYNKKMKASMKLQVKMLKSVMKLNKNSHEIKQKKPGKYLGIDYENDENLVKFGDSMRARGCSENKIALFLKFERRKAEKQAKKEIKAKITSNFSAETNFISTSETESKNSSSCFRELCD